MPYKILLVDDRKTILDGITRTLSQISNVSIVVDSAKNLYRAKVLLGKNHYDVISLDLNLPRIERDDCFDEISGTTLNGWLFLKKYIFQDDAEFRERCRDSKIIIFSGYIQEFTQHISTLPPDQEDQEAWYKSLVLIQKGAGGYDGIAHTILNHLSQ